jgi:hypothetical protein
MTYECAFPLIPEMPRAKPRPRFLTWLMCCRLDYGAHRDYASGASEYHPDAGDGMAISAYSDILPVQHALEKRKRR